MELIKKHFNIFSFLVITIVAILAYSNTFNSSFQFDDGAHIKENAKIRNFDNYTTAKFWKNVGKRPLSIYTVALNFKWGELDVRGYHIFNLLIHILTGIFAYLLTLEILSLHYFRKKSIQKQKYYIALFTGLIMIAHPLQTQAVTYIIQRMTSMAGMFYIASVFLYVKGRKSYFNTGKWVPMAIYIVAAGLAGLFALMSKQNAVTFPIAWLLVELFFVRDKDGKIYKKYLAAFIFILALGIGYALYKYGMPREISKIRRDHYLFTQFKVVSKYIQLMFLPINQNLDHWFPFSTRLGSKELLGLGFILAWFGAAAALYKKHRIVSFGIIWFFLTISVESSIIPIRDAIFEHRVYLPLYGFALAISYLGMIFISKKNQKYAIITMSVVVVILAALAFNRNTVWKTKYSLWSDVVEKSPQRERAWYWLASAYMDMQDKPRALEAYDRSVKCNPNFDMAYNARGTLRKELGDEKGAMSDYNKAIKLKPKYAKAYYNRGILNAKMKNYDKAIADYNKAIKYNYRAHSAYYNRANSKMKSGKYEAALADYDIALKKHPKYDMAYYNRGLTYAKLKDHNKAIKDINKAISIDNSNYMFYNGRGVSYLSLKKYKEAESDFTKAIGLNSKYGQAYYNRGYVRHFFLKNTPLACQDWSLALQVKHPSAKGMLEKFCK